MFLLFRKAPACTGSFRNFKVTLVGMSAARGTVVTRPGWTFRMTRMLCTATEGRQATVRVDCHPGQQCCAGGLIAASDLLGNKGFRMEVGWRVDPVAVLLAGDHRRSEGAFRLAPEKVKRKPGRCFGQRLMRWRLSMMTGVSGWLRRSAEMKSRCANPEKRLVPA